MKLNAGYVLNKYFLPNFLIWLLINLLPLLFGLMIKEIFDLLEGTNTYGFYICLILYMVLNLIYFILIRAGGMFDTKYRFCIKSHFQLRLLGFFLSKHNKSKISSGKFIDMYQNDPAMLESLCSTESDLINQLVFFLIAFIILCNINFKMTIVVLMPCVIFTNILWVFEEKLKISQNNNRNSSIAYTGMIKDILKNNTFIRYFGGTERIEKFLFHHHEEIRKNHIWKTFYSTLMDNLSAFVGELSSLLILLVGGIYFLNGYIDFSDITLYLAYFSYGTISLSTFAEVYAYYKYCETIIERLEKELIQSKQKITEILLDKTAMDSRKEPIYVEDSIMLSGISLNTGDVFKLNSDKKLTMNNVLINLGLDDKIIASVYLNTQFLNSTIYENICMYDSTVDYKNCINLANLSGEKLRNWTFDSNRKIGVNGNLLSAGQRQRVAIGRALACKSNIVIFDDIFKNLDDKNQKEIIFNLVHEKYIVIYFCDNPVLDSMKNKEKMICISEKSE